MPPAFPAERLTVLFVRQDAVPSFCYLGGYLFVLFARSLINKLAQVYPKASKHPSHNHLLFFIAGDFVAVRFGMSHPPVFPPAGHTLHQPSSRISSLYDLLSECFRLPAILRPASFLLTHIHVPFAALFATHTNRASICRYHSTRK